MCAAFSVLHLGSAAAKSLRLIALFQARHGQTYSVTIMNTPRDCAANIDVAISLDRIYLRLTLKKEYIRHTER